MLMLKRYLTSFKKDWAKERKVAIKTNQIGMRKIMLKWVKSCFSPYLQNTIRVMNKNKCMRIRVLCAWGWES